MAVGGGIYPFSSSVNLTAVPAPGHRFVGWTGTGISDPSDENLVVKVEENRTYVAVFEPISYNLEINTSSGGLVVGAGNFPYGSSVQIDAIQLQAIALTAGWEKPSLINKRQPRLFY